MLRLIRRFLLWVNKESRETTRFAREWHEEAVVYLDRYRAHRNPHDQRMVISNALRACKTMLRAQFCSIDDILYYVVEHKLLDDRLAGDLLRLQEIRDQIVIHYDMVLDMADIEYAVDLSKRVVVEGEV